MFQRRHRFAGVYGSKEGAAVGATVPSSCRGSRALSPSGPSLVVKAPNAFPVASVFSGIAEGECVVNACDGRNSLQTSGGGAVGFRLGLHQ